MLIVFVPPQGVALAKDLAQNAPIEALNVLTHCIRKISRSYATLFVCLTAVRLLHSLSHVKGFMFVKKNRNTNRTNQLYHTIPYHIAGESMLGYCESVSCQLKQILR